jgi:hypothetical protein
MPKGLVIFRCRKMRLVSKKYAKSPFTKTLIFNNKSSDIMFATATYFLHNRYSLLRCSYLLNRCAFLIADKSYLAEGGEMGRGWWLMETMTADR